MDPTANDLDALRSLIGQLAQRVDALERKFERQEHAATPAAGIAPPVVPGSLPPPSPIPPVSALPHPPPPPAPHSPPAMAPPLGPPTAPSVASAAQRGTAPEDLESRIGSHWLNRIGITAVLIGISYFLKYAFDNNWIGASGRIAIGLLAGIVIVAWSESFRKKGYQASSYSLKAVGIGALYLSLWAAFQVYALIPASVAFAAMLFVTAATAGMAVAQDAEILAAFALTGGFSTPLLLSTGQNHEVALFLYVALLDAATLALVVFKPWRRLLLLSFIATVGLYVGWYSTYYERTQLETTLFFATLFFAIFATAPIVGRRSEADAISTSVPLFLSFVNAGVYFLQVYAMFEDVDKTAMAWFALALAALYLLLSKLARDRYPEPENARRLQLLHLALAVGFITIAIPIRLDGHWITLGWFVEAAVLLWVADRISSDLLGTFALAALVLGVIRLLVFDNFDTSTLIFNWRMLTYAVSIAVLGLVAWFGSQRKDETGRMVAAFATVSLNLLALIALSREVSSYFTQQRAALASQRYQNWTPVTHLDTSPWHRLQIAEAFTYSALWMAYGAMLMIIGFWRRSAFVRWQALFLIAATIVKVFIYDVWELDRGFRIVSFIVLGVLLLAISFVYQKGWLQLSTASKRSVPEHRP